jgi:hypothetical protein
MKPKIHREKSDFFVKKTTNHGATENTEKEKTEKVTNKLFWEFLSYYLCGAVILNNQLVIW